MSNIKRLLVLLSIVFLPLQGLELNRVILSTNDNPYYSEFWPIVAPLWEAMGIRPTLALIADKDCQVDTTIGDVVRFDPIPGVPASLQAQVVRLFLPILYPDDGCIISDIDMIPISSSYFHEGASHSSDSEFLVYRNMAPGYAHGGRYPMCYMAAKGRVFSSIFGISLYAEISGLIRSFALAGHGWNTDEVMVYAYAKQWERNGGKIVYLNHSVGQRLDRSDWNINFDTIDVSQFIDCHAPRPYSAYRQSIDQLTNKIRLKRI